MENKIDDIHTEEEALKYYKRYTRCIKCGRRFGTDGKGKKERCYYCIADKIR